MFPVPQPADQGQGCGGGSHGASEFAEFIRQNETDFIRFKTKLLLDEAGDDPIKRSALITDIIRSVAIIPDNIARSVYIRECAATMEIDEQVLLNEVNKIRLDKVRNTHPKANRNEPPAPTPNAEVLPEYPDIPTFQPYVPEEETGTPSLNEPPSLPDGYIPEEESPSPSPQPERQTQEGLTAKGVPHSPFEAYELALLRYVVRYGERIIDEYEDEETGEKVILRVADYIQMDLERDDLTFYTPLFKRMLDEAADHCQEEGFVASRYFLSHPDPNVSMLGANLLSDKYQLSKYHSKFREIPQEEDMLKQLVLRDMYAIKEANILQQIKEVQQAIKEAQRQGDMERIFELLKKQNQLNEIKNILSKELGERIVLKM